MGNIHRVIIGIEWETHPYMKICMGDYQYGGHEPAILGIISNSGKYLHGNGPWGLIFLFMGRKRDNWKKWWDWVCQGLSQNRGWSSEFWGTRLSDKPKWFHLFHESPLLIFKHSEGSLQPWLYGSKTATAKYDSMCSIHMYIYIYIYIYIVLMH